MRDLSSPFCKSVWRYASVGSSLSGLLAINVASVGRTGALLPPLASPAEGGVADANNAY